MFNKKESDMNVVYNLLQILKKENEILTVLKNIDNNIIKYFGKDYDFKERELNQKINDANFSDEQFKILQEAIIYTREKHSQSKECEHEWVTCGLTTIKNPTVTKSSLPNGQYKFAECTKCGKTKIEPLEKDCEHDWVYLESNRSGDHYVCSKCKTFKVCQ